MRTTTHTALNVVQTGQIGSMLMTILLVAVVGFVGLGIYRARYAAAREEQYRSLAQRAADAEARIAHGTQATVAELRGLRGDLQAAREELTDVKQRLAGLERLLSQIG